MAHPDDVRTCSILGLLVHFQFLSDETQRLLVVEELMSSTRRNAEGGECWEEIRLKVAATVNSNRCRIEAAEFSPDGRSLAICAEVKSLLGLRMQHADMLYSLDQNAIVVRVTMVKRHPNVGFRT